MLNYVRLKLGGLEIMKCIRNWIIVFLVALIAVPVTSVTVKAATANYATSVKAYNLGSSYQSFDFDIDKTTGNPYATINLKTGMKKNTVYYIYNAKTNQNIGSLTYTGKTNYKFNLQFGVDYSFVISDQNKTTVADIQTLLAGVNTKKTTVEVPTKSELGKELAARVEDFNAYSSAIDRINLSYYCAGSHEIYIDGKRIRQDIQSKGQYNYFRRGFKPGSKHKVKVMGIAMVNGYRFPGYSTTKKVTIKKFTATKKPKIVTLGKNKISVSFTAPAAQRAADVSTFYVYTGKKKLKKVKNTGLEKYTVTIKKKNISKKKIKIVAKCTSTKKKKTSKVGKIVKNQFKWNYSSNPSDYVTLSEFIRPVKYYYDGNKLKMKAMIINTHAMDLKKATFNYRFFVNGKKVITKKIESTNIVSKSTKNITVVLGKNMYYDLVNSQLKWEYDIVKVEK